MCGCVHNARHILSWCVRTLCTCARVRVRVRVCLVYRKKHTESTPPHGHLSAYLAHGGQLARHVLGSHSLEDGELSRSDREA
jgi:hypothetical protein